MPIEAGISIPELELVRPYGCIVVPTGPSGVGKDTLMNQLLLDPDFQANQIVTYASRPPRPGEIHGKDYNFVSVSQFEDMVSRGSFAEFFNYAKENEPPDYKGTTKESFTQVFDGKNVVWRIDPSRAANLDAFYEENFPEDEASILKDRTLAVYIGLPRLTLLYDRVRQRNGGNFVGQQKNFQKRLTRDWEDWEKYGPAFENILMNDGTIEESVAALKQLIAVKFG